MPKSQTLGALVQELGNRFPDVEAVVAQDGTLTYQQLTTRVVAVAKGMLACGIEPDDKVGCWMPNQVDWPVVNLAAASIGAVLVAISTWSRPPELRYIINHSECKL